LEVRCEAFNHPQFLQVPQMTVSGTPAGRFLNKYFTDGGVRTMWVHIKLLF
jgi:hypothetical protein